MANLDDLTLEDYYDESENFSGKIPQGVFPAHIMDMNVKEDIPIKSRTETGIQHLCDIYEFTYQIAPEAASEEYKVNDTEVVKGQAFVGKTVKGKGVFKFKSVPADKKGFKNNSGGNKGFKTFLDSVKVELESKEIEDARGARTVLVLPDLTLDDVKGKPVLITVTHREWQGRDDKTMVSVEVNGTKEWSTGVALEEDIPF